MCSIEVILDDEPTKDSKEMGKRYQAFVSRANEKELNDLENLTFIIKSLTTEMVEHIEKRTSETIVSSKPPKYLFRRSTTSESSSSESTKSAHSSNVVPNIEKIGTYSYCTFHEDHHS